ncbi:hypothetical protein HPB48_015286 [Haemaphysalis longicornis]|uniref:Uncharacterized protein n=1 Tax=Haemaphysalis longicornis TaxID=44386 RepID=A0A9J6GB44_HAELO|nr:hypothetical protein HPB48_015286 [Haemaphysalis longicornis]
MIGALQLDSTEKPTPSTASWSSCAKTVKMSFSCTTACITSPPKMVLAADGLHPSFGGVSVMVWNLYSFLLEFRRPMFADWQDYASPSPNRETQQEPTFAQATLQTEPSRHLDLDWPPLTRVTAPNPATGPRPHHSLDATPAGGCNCHS